VSEDVVKVIVVGVQKLADVLAASGAQWNVLPPIDDVNAMWDAIEMGILPSNPYALVIVDDNGKAGLPPGMMEATLASFAPHAKTFFVSKTNRRDTILEDIKAQAANQGLDPNAIVYHLPAEDFKASLRILREVTGSEIEWENKALPQPSASAPSLAPAGVPMPPPAPSREQSPARFSVDESTSIVEAAQAVIPSVGYAQSSNYDPRVMEAAQAILEKPNDSRPGQTTIACMSSKGGSGKSTTAISLAGAIARASALAGSPKKVVLVDLDIRDGQVGSFIQQYMPTAVNIRMLPQINAKTVTSNLVHDRNLGIDALLAPIRPRNADELGPKFYSEVIQVLKTTHDVVILDCSVNYLDPLLGTAFALADEILFVTTLATTSVQGMARALQELFTSTENGGLGIPREKVGVVINQSNNKAGMDKNKLVQASLGASIVGVIPAEYDEVLVRTNKHQMHLLLNHPRLGEAYYKLAQRCVSHFDLQWKA
jgi:cellulose biosynthesis protein BcsQ